MIDFTKPVRTRDGRKVRILCTDDDSPRPIIGLLHGIGPLSWTETGMFSGADNGHDFDLAQDETPADVITDSVTEKFRSRAALGLAKYGQHLGDNPAELLERIDHLQQELMDAVAYCEWIMQRLAEEAGKD